MIEYALTEAHCESLLDSSLPQMTEKVCQSVTVLKDWVTKE